MRGVGVAIAEEGHDGGLGSGIIVRGITGAGGAISVIEDEFAAGAVETWTSAVTDRHGRPAVKLSIVVPTALRDAGGE